MQAKFFLISICLCHLCFYLGFLGFKLLNLSTILSFEFAFLSVLLIILSSYLNYKKNILIRTKEYDFEKKPLMIFIKKNKINEKILNFREINDDLKLDFKDKMRNYALFFPLMKILTYGVLVAGFLFLQNQKLLSILGFLSGISALFICILFFALRVKYES
ncbi:MAG: hypothetical protein J1D99_03605 [Campylobacter sp.]|nr:hypothetical protein [Campylobacter sp.]